MNLKIPSSILRLLWSIPKNFSAIYSQQVLLILKQKKTYFPATEARQAFLILEMFLYLEFCIIRFFFIEFDDVSRIR